MSATVPFDRSSADETSIGPDASRCVIIGLGNPIRGDDAVGLIVARAVHTRLADRGVTLCELAAGGIELMENLIGYDRAVIIDAALAQDCRPGQCRRLPLDAGAFVPARRDSPLRAGLSHEIDLLEGLELGRKLGLTMPGHLVVYAVAVADPFTFGEELTPAVGACVPGIVARILAEQFEHPAPG